MSNNLKIMGKTYNGVSSITAHDATSGTHTYYDNSQVDAVASDVRSGKKIMNSSGEVTGTLNSYNFTTYDLTNTTWRFKDYSEMYFTPGFDFNVRFISNDVMFTRIIVSSSYSELEYIDANISEKSYMASYHSRSIWFEQGWVDDHAPFRVVKFLENGNTTSEFFDWLNNNATLVSAEGVFYDNDNITDTRQLKSFDGSEIRLLTRNQICNRNINVYNKKPEVDELDVNFIDYDGTILYSYGYQEFANLTAWPALGVDTTFDNFYNMSDWNHFNLANTKTYVSANKKLQIGKYYYNYSGTAPSLKIKIKLEEEFTRPTLSFGLNGTATINWGDDSNNTTLTGTNIDTLVSSTHTYNYAGEFWITISTNVSESIKILGSTSNGNNISVLLAQSSTATSENRGFYQNCIKEVWVGIRCYLGVCAFAYCMALEKINLPFNSTYMTTIPEKAFYICTNLKAIVIPDSVTTIGANAFAQCCSLNKISLPYSITSIGENAFYLVGNKSSLVFPSSLTTISTGLCQQAYNQPEVIIPEGVTTIGANAFLYNGVIKKIIIPSTVTSIDSKAFANMIGLQEIIFKSTIPPTILNSDAFQNIQTNAKIYFPVAIDSNNYITNYSDYAYGTNYPGGYGTERFIGYATINSSTNVPTMENWSGYCAWKATKKEAATATGTSLTKGNGTKIYCYIWDGQT